MSNEILRERLKSLNKAVQSVAGCTAADIRNYIDGTVSISSRTKQLKITISLPADQVLHNEADVRAVLNGDWKIVPLLVFVSDK